MTTTHPAGTAANTQQGTATPTPAPAPAPASAVTFAGVTPATATAPAYTSGTTVHTPPGADPQLSHETPHVIQQKK